MPERMSNEGVGIVRLVTIAENMQRQGHGRELQGQVEDYARQLGIKTLYVSAAPNALGFYERLGWNLFEWDSSELTGIAIDCVQMRKTI